MSPSRSELSAADGQGPALQPYFLCAHPSLTSSSAVARL